MSVHDLIVLRGRAGSEVTLYVPDEGEDKRPFARFRMAVPQPRRRDDGSWEEGEAQWYTVRAWGALADNTYASVHKGIPLVVVGRPTAQAWLTEGGELRSEVAINARTIGPDLSFGATSFRRYVTAKPAEAPEPPRTSGQSGTLGGPGVPEESKMDKNDLPHEGRKPDDDAKPSEAATRGGGAKESSRAA